MTKPFFTEEDCDHIYACERFISLDQANRLLQERAKTGWIIDRGLKTMHMTQPTDATHTFQYFDVQPIEQEDSAWKIINDLSNVAGHSELINRAKKLLEKQKHGRDRTIT